MECSVLEENRSIVSLHSHAEEWNEELNLLIGIWKNMTQTGRRFSQTRVFWRGRETLWNPKNIFVMAKKKSVSVRWWRGTVRLKHL